MTRRKRNHWCAMSAAVLVVFFGSLMLVYGESVTAPSGVPELNSLKKFYSIPKFAIGGEYEIGNEAAFESGGKGGVTLESLGQEPLRVAYIDVGTPQKDKDGNIINAVLISPYYSGDATYMYSFWYDGQKGNEFAQGAIVGPGKLIDTNKYYVIFVDALGLWGASKPSDGLGTKFPRYSYYDYVQANYRLLKDKLGVGKVKLATGVSMGAMQSYIWAVMHPDFVEAIMPIGGLTATDPVVRWLFQLMTAGMQSDPVWMQTKGDYYKLPKEQHPNKGMMFGWSILGHTGLSFDFRAKQPWNVVEKEVFTWSPSGAEGANLVQKAKEFDVNDLLFRNMAGETYNIDEYIPKIKSKILILHVKNDQWLCCSKAEESCKKIPGAKIATFENPLAHYAVFRGPNVMRDDVTSFFKQIGMQQIARLRACSNTYKGLSVSHNRGA